MSAKIELQHSVHVLTRKQEFVAPAHEVEFACRFDAYPIVPALADGRLRCA